MANKVYTPSRTVKEYIVDQNRWVFIMGPFGSGKSVGSLMKIWYAMSLQDADKQGNRKSRWVVVRTTNRKLMDTTFKTFVDWFPPGLAGEWRATSKTFFVDYGLDDGTRVKGEVLFRALDDENDVANLASLELSGAYLNEMKEIDPEIFRTMNGRVGRYPKGEVDWRETGGDPQCSHPMIIGDTNPPAQTEHDWLYKLFEIDKPACMSLYKQPSGLSAEAENLRYLPGGRAYYENMCMGATEDFIRVNVHGEYGKLRGGQAIFGHCFRGDMHVRVCEYDPSLKLVLAFDYGLTPACVVMQVSLAGQIRVLDEVVSEDSGLERLMITDVEPLLVNRYPDAEVMVTGDPAGNHRGQANETTCYEVLAERGFEAYPCHTNAPAARLGAVEGALSVLVRGEPGLVIHPRCKKLVEALSSGYVYTKADKGPVSPEKNKHSHIADALQYGVLFKGRFEAARTYEDEEPVRKRIPGRGGY